MKRNVTLALKVCLYSHVVELNVKTGAVNVKY